MPQDELFYSDDLAYVHDAGFTAFVTGIAPGLLRLLHQAGIDDGPVVDLGCGSGLWSQRLEAAGYRVCGVDVSPAMITMCRQRVPGGEFHTGSLWDFELPACRAITALGEVLCYRAVGVSPQPKEWFAAAFAALDPGGLLVFDVAEVGLDRERSSSFFEGEDWSCGVRYEYDEDRNRLTRQITVFRQEGPRYRRTCENHVVQLYHRRDLGRSLRGAGFEVETVDRFGEYPLLPGRVGFVARKA